MGNTNGADWQKEVYRKIKSMKEMYLSELKYIFLKIASKVWQVPNDPLRLNPFYTYKTLVSYLRSQIEMNGNNWMAAHARGAGEGAGAAAGDWRTGLVPYTRQRIVNKILEDIQRVFPVFRHRHVQELREIAVMFEEKMYNVATSWNDYLYRISFKLRTMTNCFHINTASSGQNAHGPGVTMEATSYETTSGPEDSDKEAAEEDDEGVHKEDVVEEVVGTKEQNYVVGHKDNVRVVENEQDSSSSEVIGRPSVFFK
ncbi:mediator of RNA polymerase II transcription subunit 15a-like [Solanum stenotomum]|uniref:mediator of RNA polymerase II transcription subunit 15a-like n=1 Tax=Solanum stenotomum TaxID=172797 RepID=UPI0020D1D003|nr:mediator of RNA polymerase II transcription subunit 15a-like [Solanum stenotomum]